MEYAIAAVIKCVVKADNADDAEEYISEFLAEIRHLEKVNQSAVEVSDAVEV